MDKDKAFDDPVKYLEYIRDQDVEGMMSFIRRGRKIEMFLVFNELLPHMIPNTEKREECMRIYKRCIKMYNYDAE